ncbi:uncharacterized protein STEHIDRAFT_137783 [Stereum hirsutum FP-91666 SS1]|uniref:uncharacterized protein n=1 Tax=Stereum hirsutum (strain FP-91666) TaxID=721885 RepID=UPI000440CC68|nr:uncharacterized protein STEHIDRAFT_137783 [Stereum hirsutum FP-91666 SS1]EIM90327.1 hypothetical protein STEHIDRAFT_137783 [Stereum hirsutum FP-91666 SS1]
MTLNTVSLELSHHYYALHPPRYSYSSYTPLALEESFDAGIGECYREEERKRRRRGKGEEEEEKKRRGGGGGRRRRPEAEESKVHSEGFVRSGSHKGSGRNVELSNCRAVILCGFWALGDDVEESVGDEGTRGTHGRSYDDAAYGWKKGVIDDPGVNVEYVGASYDSNSRHRRQRQERQLLFGSRWVSLCVRKNVRAKSRQWVRTSEIFEHSKVFDEGDAA